MPVPGAGRDATSGTRGTSGTSGTGALPGTPADRRRADGPTGRTVYTPLLSDRGGYEADVTITELLRDDEPVGFASSAAFGHAAGRTVLLGYVERRDGGQADRGRISQGRYQVGTGGELHEVNVSLKPPYDPSGMRIRA
jgi:glycine cleavage system aminomethyltransferase T